jgi:hypothetical protein
MCVIRKFAKFCGIFFSNTPIDLYEREAPPGKTRPPLRRAANKKHAFLNWWPAAGLLFAARETILGQLAGPKGPTATPALKHATIRTQVVISKIASAADQCGIQEG